VSKQPKLSLPAAANTAVNTAAATSSTSSSNTALNPALPPKPAAAAAVATAAATPRNTLPSNVHNMSFLIEKLSEECPATQFLREYTHNGADAIRRLPDPKGTITWDADWAQYERTGVMKLTCTDTGIGMFGPEMVRLVNEWFTSGQVQSSNGNFGVGAKLSAATRNREGLTYLSWKDGVGAIVHMWHDPVAKVYGLRRWEQNGGEFWAPIADEHKPHEIDRHGTQVIFHGNSPDEQTVDAPPGVSMPSKWITRYLNSRYFELPEGVELRVREGWREDRQESRRHFLRKVEGQAKWLERYAESSGQVALADATAHWWILREDTDRHFGLVTPGGHTAALYQNELYEMSTGRMAMARLQSFGAIFGTNRVVIYVEPHTDGSRQPTANAARTQLKINGEGLEWAAWAAEFRDKIPAPLIDLQHEIGNRAGSRNYRQCIEDRIRNILHLLRPARYRPNTKGADLVTAQEGVGSAEPAAASGSEPGMSPGTERPRRSNAAGVDEYLQHFTVGGNLRARGELELQVPTVHWVKEADGTRSAGDLDDRAARYLPEQDTLVINRDFRVFTGMFSHWKARYAVPGSDLAIEDTVCEWFEQQLLELILSAKSLQDGGRWSQQELSALWSEAALTAAILPRWHLDMSIHRALSHRFGSNS